LPLALESPGIFKRKFQDMESPGNYRTGPGKSWKLKLKVPESPGKI